jgi:hypothetical protein
LASIAATSAHSIRATLITMALENGAHLEDVQKAAGHTATRARQSCIIGGATIRAMNDSPTFREHQVRDMAEKVRVANELITKALWAMIPDPPVRCFWSTPGGRSMRPRSSPMTYRRRALLPEAGAGGSNPLTPTNILQPSQ